MSDTPVQDAVRAARDAAEAKLREGGIDPAVVVLHVVWQDEHFSYALASTPTEIADDVRGELTAALYKTAHDSQSLGAEGAPQDG